MNNDQNSNKITEIHAERCQECKNNIQRMLETIYGVVLTNHQLDYPSGPALYLDKLQYWDLDKIYTMLWNLDEQKEFIKSPRIPPVDFFIPTLDCIVEVDESQHFTKARKLTLLNYPIDMPIGFDIKKWIRLCDEINAKDNEPIYRDAQRAWYDTMRDFIPLLNGIYKPTIRLYIGDYQWCKLDPNSKEDLLKFKYLLTGKHASWDEYRRNKIQIRTKLDHNPKIARIIVNGNWGSDFTKAQDILTAVSEYSLFYEKAICLITPGGFINFPWPKEITKTFEVINPPKEIVDNLIKIAERRCKELLSPLLIQKLSTKADFISIGIDSEKPFISLSNQKINTLHIELIALIDLRTGLYHWTGKSYPTIGQVKGLVRISDLNSHFYETGYINIMILGCHDLNIFSPRGLKTAKKDGWRDQVRKEFYIIAKNKNPFIVLHHPHTTDATMIWRAAWNRLNNEIPSVTYFAGAGVYMGVNEEPRDTLDAVLKATKKGNTIEYIITNSK